MPSAPTLSTTIIAGNTGHVAATNTVHGVIDNIYLATIGGTHTTDFTLVQADSGEFIPVNTGTTVAVTVPQLAVGTSIELYRMGAGTVTLTAGSGVLFANPDGSTLPLQPRMPGSSISLLWRLATVVVVGGDLA